MASGMLFDSHRLYTVQEAAEITGRTRQTIYRWTREFPFLWGHNKLRKRRYLKGSALNKVYYGGIVV